MDTTLPSLFLNTWSKLHTFKLILQRLGMLFWVDLPLGIGQRTHFYTVIIYQREQAHGCVSLSHTPCVRNTACLSPEKERIWAALLSYSLLVLRRSQYFKTTPVALMSHCLFFFQLLFLLSSFCLCLLQLCNASGSIPTRPAGNSNRTSLICLGLQLEFKFEQLRCLHAACCIDNDEEFWERILRKHPFCVILSPSNTPCFMGCNFL